MRDLKFRAWAAKYKQMYWFDIMWGNKHATGSGWIGMLPISETERDYGFGRDNRIEVDPHDCELMQYTGLKDKNGKEIYEGDYVRIIYKLKEEGVYEVAWNQEHCCFMMGRMLPDNSDADTVYFGNQFDYEYEVVGNIYENPELLNSEQNVQASVATEADSSNKSDKQNQTP